MIIAEYKDTLSLIHSSIENLIPTLRRSYTPPIVPSSSLQNNQITTNNMNDVLTKYSDLLIQMVEKKLSK